MNEIAKEIKKFIFSICRQRELLLRNNKSLSREPRLYDMTKQVQIDLIGYNSNIGVCGYLIKNYETIYKIMPKNRKMIVRINQLNQYKEISKRVLAGIY